MNPLGIRSTRQGFAHAFFHAAKGFVPARSLRQTDNADPAPATRDPHCEYCYPPPLWPGPDVVGHFFRQTVADAGRAAGIGFSPSAIVVDCSTITTQRGSKKCGNQSSFFLLLHSLWPVASRATVNARSSVRALARQRHPSPTMTSPLAQLSVLVPGRCATTRAFAANPTRRRNNPGPSGGSPGWSFVFLGEECLTRS
jgi:hypothetical protein